MQNCPPCIIKQSPLIQGAIETLCKVFVRMQLVIRSNEILEWFLDLVKSVYSEPEFPAILASLQMDEIKALLNLLVAPKVLK